MKNKYVSSRLVVRVSPKSSQTGLKRDANGELKLFLNSPPVDGKANEECLKYLSKLLHIPKTNITIVSGEKSRIKTFEFYNLDPEKLKGKIDEVLA